MNFKGFRQRQDPGQFPAANPGQTSYDQEAHEEATRQGPIQLPGEN